MHTIRHVARKVLRQSFLQTKKLFFGSTVIADDPYVRYLEYVCGGGMFEKGNLYAWEKAIQALPEGVSVVEIGAFSGVSTNILTYLLEKYGKQNPFFSVDCWRLQDNEAPFFHKQFAFENYNRFVKESFIRNTKFFSGNRLPFAIEATSKDFFKMWRAGESITDLFGRSVRLGGKIGFCFIDGDHSDAGAKQDFLDTHAFLPPGGLVLFDDSSDGSGWDQLNRLMGEVAARSDYALFLKNPNYLFKRVGGE